MLKNRVLKQKWGVKMEDENKVETPEEAKLAARRKFLKTAAKVAVTAPAVTMLLSAPTKSFAGGECITDPYTGQQDCGT